MNTFVRFLLIPGIAVAIAGAAILHSAESHITVGPEVAKIASKATVTRDDFKKKVTLRMAENEVSGYTGRLRATYYLVCTKRDANEKPADPFLVFTCYRSFKESWVVWFDATDAAGVALEFDRIGQNVGDASISETVSVTLPREYLERIATTGVTIRIDGKNAKQEVALSANYIKAFLAKMDELR